jgi:hypothetical protein
LLQIGQGSGPLLLVDTLRGRSLPGQPSAGRLADNQPELARGMLKTASKAVPVSLSWWASSKITTRTVGSSSAMPDSRTAMSAKNRW